MNYDSIVNRGDYLSPHYLAEVLPRDLKKQGSLRTRWAERDKAGQPTPVKGLRALRRTYFEVRPSLSEEPASDQLRHDELQRQTERQKEIASQNGFVLRALGYPAAPRELTVERGGEPFAVQVAYAGQNVIAVDCEWATDTDAAFDADSAGRLLSPVELGSREKLETGAKLARWLFAADEPPRYVLLLHGGVIVLADRLTWGEGRYLAVCLDAALERNQPDELELIAALFSADALQPPAEGGEEALATFVNGSRQHAVGVSAELREGLRESVQIIANEVLDRLHEHDVRLDEVENGTARELGRQSLRYLYRILFLLYAEARPELGILPVDDADYIAGYSMARLGDLIARRLGGGDARRSFHLYESLAVLFRMVNDGHHPRGPLAIGDEAPEVDLPTLSEGEGLRFEALKADLFDPARTTLIGGVTRSSDDPDDPGTVTFDTRLRDAALYRVLRRLMLSRGGGAGRGASAGRGRGRGRTERGGFISYAQLGISQLGAVYEGLMSYTGFIADEDLYEVAKNGDPSGGSWMIPASKVPDYADDVFVKVRDEHGVQSDERVRYRPGSFVYRLAGRDRQTSASYYTPQSLTSVTVQLALEQRIKEQENPPGGEPGTKVTADQVLRWRVCEPALGSGAFLNEAIDQLAALYLRLREEEAHERLEPEERALALQRVKAYVALHNCYGVDLNETAVELAEVSIWLNVMHRGLQAPWFGLHLVRGNSLIGAGRRLYPAHALTAKDSKQQWLNTAPVDHPFSAGKIPTGHVHHFLLPAAGWGAVAGEKEAKELAPERAKQLANWRRAIRKAPSDKKTKAHKLSQVQRLQALSLRVEYLWSLVIERLRISEREISRPIEVWSATDLPKAQEAKPRDEIVWDLTMPGTPYWRLKTVMDAWCALWFWPLDKAGLLDGTDAAYPDAPPAALVQAEPTPEPESADPDPNFPQVWEMDSLFGDAPKQLTPAEGARKQPRPKPAPATHRSPVPLANMDDWLDFAEALLGRQEIKEGTLARTFDTLMDLSQYEDELEDQLHMDMDPIQRLGERFPWLDTVHQIAEQQGFFHWELRFASVFSEGGFDLQVGNPPWVRPQWDEDSALAEFDPWFELTEKASAATHDANKVALLSTSTVLKAVLSELTVQSAMGEFFGSRATYELLVGTAPDLYRAFMIRTWRGIGRHGTVGLLHPDTHFGGNREGALRGEAYRLLRRHGDFVNALQRFFPRPVGDTTHFGIHIYGHPKEIGFDHLSWLTDASEMTKSLALAERREIPDGWDPRSGAPAVRYNGEWDSRPHPARVLKVDLETLALWNRLTGDADIPVGQAKLLLPVSTEEQEAIARLADYPTRVGEFSPQDSLGLNETIAKKAGLIDYDLSLPGDWSEVILKGIQIGLANPMFKSPNANSNDAFGLDLVSMPVDATPQTAYKRVSDISKYEAQQDAWIDHRTGVQRRYAEFYRLAWRRQIAPNTERSLYAAIIPPGPTHTDLVNSLILANNRSTVLAAGFWTSLPLDYFLRITGKADLRISAAKTMPFGALEHPLAQALLFRAMRLNCLTDAYGSLWAELYDGSWRDDIWACPWSGLPALGDVSPSWSRDIPLRTERVRRSALVEIDALVAVWLGMDADALIAIYQAAFPVLNRYEEITWFDANGSKLAGYHRTYGQYQKKDTWEQFQAYLENPDKNPPPDGYTPPFYKADRIAEYRQAHAAFTERMNANARNQ